MSTHDKIENNSATEAKMSINQQVQDQFEADETYEVCSVAASQHTTSKRKKAKLNPNSAKQSKPTIVQVLDQHEDSETVDQPALSSFQTVPPELAQAVVDSDKNQEKDESSYGSQISSQQVAVDESAILQVLQSPPKMIQQLNQHQNQQKEPIVISTTATDKVEAQQSQPAYDQYAIQATAPSLPKHLPPFEPQPNSISIPNNSPSYQKQSNRLYYGKQSNSFQNGNRNGDNKREMKQQEKDDFHHKKLLIAYNNLQQDFVSISKTLAESLRQLTQNFMPIFESKERENQRLKQQLLMQQQQLQQQRIQTYDAKPRVESVLELPAEQTVQQNHLRKGERSKPIERPNAQQKQKPLISVKQVKEKKSSSNTEKITEEVESEQTGQKQDKEDEGGFGGFMIGKKRFEIDQERIDKAAILMQRFQQLDSDKQNVAASDEEDPANYLKIPGRRNKNN